MVINEKFTPENEKAALYLMDIIMGYNYQASLRAVAVLGVADHLLSGPKTAKELAKELHVDALPLHRVMRLLATRDVFKEIEGQQFILTPAAECLCKSSPYSLRPAAMMLTDETFWRPAGIIAESVRGHSAFKKIFNTSFFEYWSNPDNCTEENDFHAGMSSMSEVENPCLVRSYDFPKNATVVDVAGGMGGLLLRVLKANPTLHGILFDRDPVLARTRLGELGDDSRWELQPGSFFESLPQADIYMLKYIVHDWPDEKATEILRSCRKAMRPNGKVLIMDTLIQEDNKPHFGKSMDILMLGSFDGGRERTEVELRGLLTDADLKINRIIDTGTYLTIVEAVAR